MTKSPRVAQACLCTRSVYTMVNLQAVWSKPICTIHMSWNIFSLSSFIRRNRITDFFLMICSLCCHFGISACPSPARAVPKQSKELCLRQSLLGQQGHGNGKNNFSSQLTAESVDSTWILRKIHENFARVGEFQTKWVAKFPPDSFCFQRVQLPPVAATVHLPTRCNQPLTCKLLP